LVECFVNDEHTENIRFPITEVGKKSSVIMVVRNDYTEKVQLIPFAGDNEVEVEDYPKFLKVGESAEVVWTFSPSVERRVSLDCQCGFKEIIG